MIGSNVIKKRSEGNGRDGRRAPGAAGRRDTLIVKRQVVEARDEAKRLRTEAEREASEIVARARESSRELRESAYRSGREAALGELNRLVVAATEQRDQSLANAERDLLRLSVRIAEKIIGGELRSEPETIRQIVSTALRTARQQESLTVRVNPADAEVVQRFRQQLSSSARAQYIDIVPDPRVTPGGCIIETEAGTVDAQLETQLRVLERALLERTTNDRRE